MQRNNNNNNDATESSPLLAAPKKTLPSKLWTAATTYTPIATQLGLGAIGLGAGFLYAGPAKMCAESATCGLWLTNITNKKVAIAVFFAGGLDFAGINAYFSSDSVKNFILFESEQTSWLKKIGWGSAILFYTGSQSVSSYLSSSSTGSNQWQTALTVAGAIPGNLYSAVGNAKNEIPAILSFIRDQYRLLHHGISDLCITPSSEETLIRLKKAYYNKQRRQFLSSVDNHWSYVKSYPHNHQGAVDTPALHTLFHTYQLDHNTFFRRTVNRTGQAAAAALSTSISVPFILNNYSTLLKYVPNPAGSGALTAYFSYSYIYSNYKLCKEFIDGVILVLDHIITGRPIDSLIYKLHPYLTIGALALIVAVSAMSYALINVVYEMVFPEKGPTRDAFRYLADVTMILYHIAGLYNLYELLLSRFTPIKQDQFLLKIQTEVERLHRMTPDEFQQFVESNSDADNTLMTLQRFQQPASGQEIDHEISRSILSTPQK